MPQTLPDRPSLERLRREARAFQRACLAGNAEATRRLAAMFPDLDPSKLALTKAQAVVARGYGFPSWPALKAEVEARRAPTPKSGAVLDAETLAGRWLALAELGDLAALGPALAVGKRRETAARAVMRRSPKRYARFQAALVGGLASPQSRIRFQCAHALDTFGDATVQPALVRLMDDPVPRVRWMAMHALSCHACGEKPGALEDAIRERIIRAAMGDPSPQVRRHAAVALGLAHEAAAASALDSMLARETDPKTLRMAGWAKEELTRRAKAASGGL